MPNLSAMSYCTIRECINHSVATRSNVFCFTVPNAPIELRKKWLVACRRDDLGQKTNSSVCELHFNVMTVDDPISNNNNNNIFSWNRM